MEEIIFRTQIWETINEGSPLDWNKLKPELKENEYLITLPQIFQALKSKALPLHIRKWFESMKKRMVEEEDMEFQLLKPGIKSHLERRGTKKQRRKWNHKHKFLSQKLSPEDRRERELERQAKEMKKRRTFLLKTFNEFFVEPLQLPEVKIEEVKPKKRRKRIGEKPIFSSSLKEIFDIITVEDELEKEIKPFPKKDEMTKGIEGMFSGLGVRI